MEDQYSELEVIRDTEEDQEQGEGINVDDLLEAFGEIDRGAPNQPADLPDLEIDGGKEEMERVADNEPSPEAEKKAKRLLNEVYKSAENGVIDENVVRTLRDYYGKRTDIVDKVNSHLEEAGSSQRLIHDPKSDTFYLKDRAQIKQS
jgi:hypothetical protein